MFISEYIYHCFFIEKEIVINHNVGGWDKELWKEHCIRNKEIWLLKFSCLLLAK